MKPVRFMGDSLNRLRNFPDDARQTAGFQIDRLQHGLDPDEWKPMSTVAPGVREIRIRARSGAFRVIYLATLEDAVVILHAFQKKTEQTPKRDIELVASRLQELRRR